MDVIFGEKDAFELEFGSSNHAFFDFTLKFKVKLILKVFI